MSSIDFSALTGEALQAAILRHSEVNDRPIGRGSKKEQFNYGTMIARGKRVPMGGRLGDTYAVYSSIKIDEEKLAEGINALFNHALVSCLCLCKMRYLVSNS